MRALIATASLSFLFVLLYGCESGSQPSGDQGGAASAGAKTVEVACARCVYKKEGLTQCTAACKLDGEVVLLEGEGVDVQKLMTEHHFCKAAIQAEIEGERKGDRFVASSFQVKTSP